MCIFICLHIYIYIYLGVCQNIVKEWVNNLFLFNERIPNLHYPVQAQGPMYTRYIWPLWGGGGVPFLPMVSHVSAHEVEQFALTLEKSQVETLGGW